MQEYQLVVGRRVKAVFKNSSQCGQPGTIVEVISNPTYGSSRPYRVRFDNGATEVYGLLDSCEALDGVQSDPCNELVSPAPNAIPNAIPNGITKGITKELAESPKIYLEECPCGLKASSCEYHKS